MLGEIVANLKVFGGLLVASLTFRTLILLPNAFNNSITIDMARMSLSCCSLRCLFKSIPNSAEFKKFYSTEVKVATFE